MNTRCIIIDDEPLAIKVIKSHLLRFDFIEILAECKNAFQAIDILRKERVDLLFLDIKMPKITGLEFLSSLPHPPNVIITTAYREYALEGYELNVVDYLLKPISFERFLKAINKYCERIEKYDNHTNSESKQYEPYIYVQDGKTIHKVVLNEILYFEGYGEYVKVHTSKKVFLSRETMHEYESKLNSAQFIRVHKSFIIPISKISAFTFSSIFINTIEIPLGRTYKDVVFEKLKFTAKRDNYRHK
jgi:DNA-binding LytR/AlgR family response regulator